jgi:hypothetical protein
MLTTFDALGRAGKEPFGLVVDSERVCCHQL